MVKQRNNVVIRCVACVDRKAGMLSAYLRAADGVALQAAPVNERRGIAAHGALERAACRGHVKRLTCRALIVHFLHARGDSLGVVGRELEHRAHDRTVYLLKCAAAVFKAAVGAFDLGQRLRRNVVHDDGFDDILHLSAVSSGVHQNAAAHRAGNAACKLKPGKAVVARKLRELCKRYAGFGVDGVLSLAKAQLAQVFRADDHDIKPLIGEDDVGALAERQRRNAVHMQIEHDLRHLEKIARHGKRAPLAADLERAVVAHRLVFPQIELGHVLLYLFNCFFKTFHNISY